MNTEQFKTPVDKIAETLEGDAGPSSPTLGPLERIAIAIEGSEYEL